jgi:hypothetical protein
MVMLYKTITKKSAPSNWQESFISKYATSHPWKTGQKHGHYLHIMDMVETAYFFFGLNVKPIGKQKR